jgi:hypothetical protein
MNDVRLVVALLAMGAIGGGACGGGSISGGTSGSGGRAGQAGGSSGQGTGGRGQVAAGSTGTGPSKIAGLALFYTDLTSGPKTGGQNDKGAFVTVFGNGFGDARGSSTVTIGGGTADNYPIWTSTKITFQLGAAAATGNVVVHVGGKGDSNGLPFTVRAGKIFFVSPSGKDTNDGSFAAPWQTIPQAKNSLAAGDTAYLGTAAGDTLAQTVEDPTASFRCALGMSAPDGASNAGTASAPKALVAYPGAHVTIGAESGLERGVLAPAIAGTFDYWVISQLTLRGETEAIDIEGPAQGWRVVGNDISCPNGTGKSGCVTEGDQNASGMKFLGNVLHDAASKVAQATKYYHGIYLASDHLELGWNTVRDGKTCRAIQFHDSSGPNASDIVVHDNVIHGTVCDGLNFATVDPSKGAVVAYNNVIYDVGLGPDPFDGSAIYACIDVSNITNSGPDGSGDVKVFNNTMYNCGPRGTGASGGINLDSGPVGIQMDDNLIVAVGDETYISGDSGDAPQITGSNNLLFGSSGGAPAYLKGTILGDPMLVDAATHDFHLGAGSAAVDHGIATSAITDFDGNARPQGSAFDVGAYELAK